MSILSSLGSYSLDCGLSLIAPWHSKVGRMLKGRGETIARMQQMLSPERPTIWVHVSSLGEFEQGRPLIEAIRERYSNYQILVSFYSPSGYEVRSDYKGADCVVYFPGDTPRVVRRFLDVAKPEIAIFIKYDFWPVTLEELKKRGIATYVVSAIFRKDQAFFQWYGTWYRSLLHCFTHIFVQDASSVDLLKAYGISEVSVAGDTRFDRVEAISKNGKNISAIEQLKALGEPLVVVGSSWPEDEAPVLDYLETHKGFRLILAPHELEEERIAKIEQRFGNQAVRLSFLEANQISLESVRVLIIDCFGLLSSLYRYADLVYIGGGFGKGIHNTVEAAVYGVPIIFGPRYDKFREAKLLIEKGGAFPVGNTQDIFETFDVLLKDSQLRVRAGQASREVVESQLGATEKILSLLELKS